tara:strand:+ start:8384 stop:9013 length:630 start_codon:yes stop_codon:yes gene_type:complete
MAMRSQIYEWANFGTSVRRSALATAQTVTQNQALDIFIGGVGNNITKPAETTATQFVVIEDISASPHNGGSAQVRINTTDYFQNPDVTVMSGIPGRASPYPVGAPSTAGPTGTDNVLSSFNLYPDVYVLPGQTWSVLYTPTTTVIGDDGSGATCGVACFVKYTLYDGPDALIANKLLELGVTVNPNNVDWYKRTLIEQASAPAMNGGVA